MFYAATKSPITSPRLVSLKKPAIGFLWNVGLKADGCVVETKGTSVSEVKHLCLVSSVSQTNKCVFWIRV